MPAPGEGLAGRLLENIPLGVVVTDASGRISLLNPAVRGMLPIVPPAEGSRPSEAIPVERVAQALEGPFDPDEFELESGNKQLLVRAIALDEGGRMLILQDITRFHTSEQAKSDFVSNAAHELRTPATAIGGYAETLLDEKDKLDPVHFEMIEVIYRNAKRLIDLFDDLLHLAKLDAIAGELPCEPVLLRPIVDEILDRLKPKADGKDMTLQNVVPDDMRVLGNKDALNHVIGNLVDNGIKYSPSGGVVTVRGRHYDDGRVLIEVIDLGHGIDPVHHKRIFERFYRVDKGRSRDVGGTGLGLAIVKRLVLAMGGDIELRSRPGRGSVFRVFLAPG